MRLSPPLDDEYAAALAGVLADLDVPREFSAEALAEAEAARPTGERADRTDLPLLTIDPPGSRDLDQAVALARRGTGYRVSYAIADVAAHVRPGGAVDAEAWRRGQTLYAPSARIPLHPPVLGEDRGSLLPDADRPAVLWELDLDADGELTTMRVARALVRSRRRLDYAGVQRALDDGTTDEQLLLLREVGLLREERGRERGAVDLPSLEQEVELGSDGRPCLVFRAPLPVEGWNAQISLLTGIAAAALQLGAGVGVLRTLPAVDPAAVAELRTAALALGAAWPEGATYGEVVSALDPEVPAHAAVLALATRLLRGAAYTSFDGAPPEVAWHSGVAAAYAHVTAPLRRLVDRYATEAALAAHDDRPVPDWVRAALPRLPEAMAASDRRAGEVERAAVDLAEAVVLAARSDEVFSAVVLDERGTVQLREPAVRARLDDAPAAGSEVEVRVAVADPATRTVRLRRA